MKGSPIVRRIAAIEHSLEYLRGIRFGDASSQGYLIVYPSEDNDPRHRIISKEEAKPSISKFCAKPAILVAAQRLAPTIGAGRWIGRDLAEDKLVENHEQLCVRAFLVLFRVFRFQCLNRMSQLFQLIEK